MGFKIWKLLFFACCTLSFGALQAQSTAQITVFDNKTKLPIDNVTILFMNGDKMLGGARTNENGSATYSPNLPFDHVEIKRLGYEPLKLQKGYLPEEVFLKSMPQSIEEVVITGQIVPGNKYQSPFKLKYYTEEEIKNKNSVTLGDFFQTENNFTVRQDPVLGSVVSLNGMSGQDLKVMVDGTPVTGRLNGNIDFSQILLNNIERIEVVDGPLSVIYGTNSAAGVINLITKSKVKENQTIAVNTYAETVGQLNINANFGFNYEGNQIQFGFGRNFFGGWDPNADSLRNAIKPLWRDVAWNPKEQYFANFSFYRKLNAKSTLHLKYNGFWEDILNKLNPTSPYSNIVQDNEYVTERHTFTGTYNLKLPDYYELVSSANFSVFNRDIDNYYQDLTSYQRGILNTNSDRMWNFFTRNIIRQNPVKSKIKSLYGVDFNYDHQNLYNVSPTAKKYIYELGFFSMFNIQISNKLFFQPGLRLAFNSTFLTPIAPTVNFRYEANSWLSTRVSYSRGYRTPELKELYFNFVDNNHNIHGNPDLQPEYNDNWQLGFDIKPEKGKKKYSYSTAFTFSYILKSKAIELLPINLTTNEFQYANIGETQAMIFTIDNRINYLDFIFNFGCNVTGNSKRYSNVTNQIDQFFFNPSVNLNVTYPIKEIETELTLLSKLYTANTFTLLNIAEDKVATSTYPAYFLMDLNAKRSFWEKKLTITLGVKNIFNVQNLSIVGYNGNVHSASNSVNNLWGRTAFITLNLNLTK